MSLARGLASLALACVVGASWSCASPSTGDVVLGVTSDLRLGVDVGSVRVRATVDGTSVFDGTRTVADGLSFPLEVPLERVRDGRAVEFVIDALPPGSSAPIVTRLASTKVVGSRKLLLETSLDASCMQVPGGVTCEAPAETCRRGQCVSPFEAPEALPDYQSDWASGGGDDPCKPGGAPEVIVGEGQGDYLPLTDGDVVQVEAGPQGGYHVWVAYRAKNLTRAGSITRVTGVVPALSYETNPYQVIFSLDLDEGGYCELHGLRFQIDSAEMPVASLLGQTLEITVEVTDQDGDVGVGTRTVVLSQDTV